MILTKKKKKKTTCKKKKIIYSTPIIVFTYYFGHISYYASFYCALFQYFHDIWLKYNVYTKFRNGVWSGWGLGVGGCGWFAIRRDGCFYAVVSQNSRMANSIDPDQMAPSGVILSVSALFAYAILLDTGVQNVWTSAYFEGSNQFCKVRQLNCITLQNWLLLVASFICSWVLFCVLSLLRN